MNAPMRFLIVEDEPMIAMMIEDFLDVVGCGHAGTADSVAQARALVETCDADAVILDMHLRDGEHSDPFAAFLAERGIPFIVSTGAMTDAFSDRPVLLKPFTLEQFENAVELLRS